MALPSRNLLITGLPGTGKTTLIMKLARKLGDVRARGFYTKEIRRDGTREGFEIVDLQGERTPLSNVNIRSDRRVGKYGVDPAGFERYLESARFSSPQTDLVIIDEIGKMECLSEKFRRVILDLLDAPVMVVATIALHGDAFIESIKDRKDIRLYELTRENRDALVPEIEKDVRAGLAREA